MGVEFDGAIPTALCARRITNATVAKETAIAAILACPRSCKAPRAAHAEILARTDLFANAMINTAMAWYVRSDHQALLSKSSDSIALQARRPEARHLPSMSDYPPSKARANPMVRISGCVPGRSRTG